jgi:hypothetical protein
MRVKLELSKFDGDEKQSVAWINKAEEYFEIHNVQFDDEKIKYTSMQLEGNAYNWYMWWKSVTRVCSYSWDRFKNNFFKEVSRYEKK